MIDSILYVSDFTTLVGYFDDNHPDNLARDENGAITQPPIITGLARTPATMGADGNSLLVYARLTEEQAGTWRDTPGVEVLAQAPYQGNGTGNVVYEALFADPDATAKYDSVYDRTPREVDDGEGGTMTITPPAKFGVMA